MYLGHVITEEGKFLSPKRIVVVQSLPKLIRKKQIMFFSGTTSYFRQWIPNDLEREAHLSSMVKASAHMTY